MWTMLLIRPGILVHLGTEVHDTGLSYDSQLLEESGTVKKTLVTRTMLDAKEHERAIKARGAARAVIEAVCSATPFGLLCPQADEAKLNDAIAQAEAIAERHRRGYTADDGTEVPRARYTRVEIYTMLGRIAETDERAASSIAKELRRLFESIDQGISALDVDKVREAATKAKEMSAMLTPEMGETVSAAVKQARIAAREITRRIEKKGETAATVLSEIERSAIANARMAFIEPDAPSEDDDTESMPAVASQRFADVDTDDSDDESQDLAQAAIERDAASF